MGLIDDVWPGPVGVHTAAFIYFIEANPTYLPALRPLFDAADREVLTIVTSAVTLLEVLVVPYRAGNQLLAQRYEALLTLSTSIDSLKRILRSNVSLTSHLRSEAVNSKLRQHLSMIGGRQRGMAANDAQPLW